jgi:hypothetical protein
MTYSTPGDEAHKRSILDHGIDALRRIHNDQTYEDWLTVGAALLVITEESCAEVSASGWNKDNKRLIAAFNRRWEAYNNRALVAGTNQDPLTKQERAQLRVLMTTPEIGVWRSKQKPQKQRGLTHPNTIVNAWRAALKREDAELGAAQPGAQPTGLRAEVARLQQEADEANAKLRKAERNRDNVSEGRDWSWSDSDDDIAAAWYRLQPTKAVRIASKVLQLSKATTAKPKVKRGAAA